MSPILDSHTTAMSHQISDDVLDHLETAIPELARAATNQAYWDALASGSSVLICEEGMLFEVSSDGTRRLIGPASRPTLETVHEASANE